MVHYVVLRTLQRSYSRGAAAANTAVHNALLQLQVARMERLELQLIEQLKTTQVLQQRAYTDLETALHHDTASNNTATGATSSAVAATARSAASQQPPPQQQQQQQVRA
jgi:hypothetical protein